MRWLDALGARWRSIDPLWVDWVPVAGLLLLTQVELVGGVAPPGAPTLAVASLTVAMVLPLGWRRQAPLPVLLAVMAAVVTHAVVAGPLLSFGTFLAAMLALYSVAAHRDGWQPVVGAAATAAAVIAAALLDPQPPEPFEWVFPLVYFGGAYGVGRVARARRTRTAYLAERVAQADREREQHVRLATAEERARIARELHDIVAHSIGVMVVQAEAADEMLAHAPDRARQPLERVQSTGRQALGELRQLLGVLRADTDGAEMDPQPGIADLPELVGSLEEAGLRVQLRVEGEPRSMPAGLELSAYRIVQEALTNSVNHGSATAADVTVRYRPAALELRISDRGRANGQAPPGGHGLIGMRERVALFGGRLEAGPRAGGGYRVEATLPLDPP